MGVTDEYSEKNIQEVSSSVRKFCSEAFPRIKLEPVKVEPFYNDYGAVIAKVYMNEPIRSFDELEDYLGTKIPKKRRTIDKELNLGIICYRNIKGSTIEILFRNPTFS